MQEDGYVCYLFVIKVVKRGSVKVELQRNRTVIAAENLRVDGSGLYMLPKAVGDEEVVNTPASVIFSCVETVAPPGIGAC